MRKLARAATLVTGLVLGACAPTFKAPPSPPSPPPLPAVPAGPLSLNPVSFYHLSGWQNDRVSEALRAYLRSCRAFAKMPPQARLGDGRFGTVQDWLDICAAAAKVSPAQDGAARRFFEEWFEPALVAGGDNADGLFTGYYEASLKGSWHRTPEYSAPLYARPKDMVTVHLNKFMGQGKNRVLIGKVQNGQLVPYDKRVQIDTGPFGGRAKPIMWVSDSVDSFFLHIQGSGRVTMTDGTSVRVGYAANNGHKFVGIGGIMKRRGQLKPGQASMQSIRDWLRANPEKGKALMAENPRYIFFRVITGDGPIGSQGVALTPRRSLAVDRRYLPLGVPLWLETTRSDGVVLKKLMIAQDTGSAIKGPVRGDFFWGHGEAALAMAGGMKSVGRYYALLPRHRVRPVAQQQSRKGTP